MNNPERKSKKNDADNYRQINQLRMQGFSEIFFSTQDENHEREYKSALAKLALQRFDYYVVEVEGTVILFVSEKTAEFLGISARRTDARQVFCCEIDGKES